MDLVSLFPYSPVTQWRLCGQPPLSYLLHLALFNLFRQVVYVILGHRHLDIPYKLLVGSGLPVQHAVLLHKMHLAIWILVYPFVDEDGIPEVPGEAINLLAYDHLDAVLLDVTQHLVEGCPSTPATGRF